MSGECIIEAQLFNELAAGRLSQLARDVDDGYMLKIQDVMSSYRSLLFRLP